ncbi:MAG: BatA domain-containing protein [Moraxellaceae bacterium]
MKWVYPEFLFALAVILIPLLIHLFHFKRYKTVFFSSLTFLKSIEQEQKSTRKLKHWLLFALRALAFAFLVFAFAQPFKPLSTNKQEAAQPIIGVFVDNSFSMSRIGENGELLSQAKELAKSLGEKAPRNARFVLFTNELSGDEKQLLTKAALLEQIDKLTFSPLVRSFDDVSNWWQQYIIDAKRNGSRIATTQLVYLSDFQKNTFGKIKAKQLANNLVYPVILSPVSSSNLYIDSVWFDSPTHKMNRKETVFIRVKNEGNEVAKNTEVSLKIGKMKRDLFANLTANGSDTVELSYFNNQSGIIECVATINDKQMMQDDAFYFNYEVKKQANVLLINGEDAVSNIERVLELDDFYVVKTMDQNDRVSTETTDLIIVNGANNLSQNTQNQLINATKEGVTLLLFPGKNATLGAWNNLLAKVNMPLFAGLYEAELSVKTIALSDNFFDGVFEKKPENISLPAAKTSYRTTKNSTTQAVDLMRFQNGAPFFVKSTGSSPVFLATVSLHSDHSSFTSNQLFSTLVLRTAELSQKSRPYFLTIGNSKAYPVTTENTNSDQPIHIIGKDCDFIPRTLEQKNVTRISIQGMEAVRRLLAGNYNIQKGGVSSGNLSLNYDRKESHIASYTNAELTDAFAKANYKIEKVSDALGWSGASFLSLTQPVTYWKWCVIFALVFLIAEMMVVHLFKK